MDYKSYSKDRLIEKIYELELFIKELLKEKEQEIKLEYSWTGNLGHWYWNVKTNSVTFNPLKVTALGYDKEEIPDNVTYQFFTDKLHPEDYKKTMDAMIRHLEGDENIYEAEYRIRTKDGKYKWYYDRGKIIRYDEKGKPLFLSGIVFDITERKEDQLKLEEKNKILAEISSFDGLTKIRNHRTLFECLKSEIMDSQRTGKMLTIAMLDIDDFKNVNDTRGHIYGDRVLKDVAKIIESNIRSNDIAGRYGGEEFMIIFPGTSLPDAAKVSERIRKAIESCKFISDITITISGGLSQYKGEKATQLIDRADKNLYKAKKSGRNRIIR